MKLACFDDFKLGVLKGTDALVDVTPIVKDVAQGDPRLLVNALIEKFADYRKRLEGAVSDGKPIPLTSVKLRPPVPRPGNIECMAVNYIEEMIPTPPPINGFHKSPNAVIGPGDTMILPDAPATIFEGEAELGVVIGKRTSNVSAAHAMSHVFGYINFIDGSARELPPPGNTFYQTKSRETFAPIGPYLVTADEISDPHQLNVKLWVNGTLKQDFSTADMANKIPRCIEWISSIHHLDPGDIIATGTNHGGLNPFMDGDVVEIEATGLGRLRINVRDDLKRTWARDTRLDRHRKKLPPITPQLTGKYAPAPK
jgi:2-keto-4-pentenoate hydratase/2-oxohepta-3-ene-1,7-dioic acid hydratase in catechol pathway